MKENRVLWFGALPFILAFLIWYPPIWTYMDENIYIGLANVLKHGTIFADKAGVQIPFMTWNQTHLVSQYPLGMPALIALFSLLGWPSIFLINTLAMLVGFAFFAQWLRLEGFSKNYAWFYLYYPTAVFYSRTVMSEIVCMALVTAACFQYRRTRFFLAGLLVGFGANVRNPISLVLLAMLLTRVVEFLQESRPRFWQGLFHPVLTMCLGALPGFLLVFFYNYATTGNALLPPYILTKGRPLSMSFVPKNLLLFGQSLIAIYPFMLLCLGLAPWRKFSLPVITVIVFALFHALLPTDWITGNQWNDLFQRLVLQHRYLLPIIPAFLLLYIACLDRLFKAAGLSADRWRAVLLIVLAIIAATIHGRHNEYLRELSDLQKISYGTIPEKAVVLTNYDGVKLFNDAWGKRRWVLLGPNGQWEARTADSEEVFYEEVFQKHASRGRSAVPQQMNPNPELLKRVDNEWMSLAIYRFRPSSNLKK